MNPFGDSNALPELLKMIQLWQSYTPEGGTAGLQQADQMMQGLGQKWRDLPTMMQNAPQEDFQRYLSWMDSNPAARHQMLNSPLESSIRSLTEALGGGGGYRGPQEVPTQEMRGFGTGGGGGFNGFSANSMNVLDILNSATGGQYYGQMARNIPGLQWLTGDKGETL